MIRELPRLPVVNDATLVTALTGAGERHQPDEQARERARTEHGELVRRAIHDPPPTELHDQFQQQVGQALSALALAAGAVAAAATALSPANDFNAFKQVGVSSSQPSALHGVANHGAVPALYRLQVERLARQQENVGRLLAASSAVILSPGEHRLDVSSRYGRKNIAVQVEAGMNNDLLVNLLAAHINLAALGLLATVSRPAPGSIQIVVTGSDTGAGGAFQLTDGSGLLVQATGADQVAQPAEDASYVINGISTVSPDNGVALQGGKVRITLLRGSDGLGTITVGADAPIVADAVQQLVDALNVLWGVVAANTVRLSADLTKDLEATLAAAASDLAELQVRAPDEHQLVFDREAFEALFLREPLRVQAIFGSADGPAQRIGRFATALMSTPIARFGASRFVPPLLPPNRQATPSDSLAGHTLSALLYTQLFARGLYVNSLF